MKYVITRDYINIGNSRPGDKLHGPHFGVAHDTGNPGSTARNNRDYFQNQQPSASAHTFIDDKEILEIIPLWEKAYHVQYQKPYDNKRFGKESNDAAIGVELCWGPGINWDEAYKRYVWYWAHLCKQFKWDPHEKIASHKQLDPERRTDPDNALNRHGITWEQFLDDLKAEIEAKTVDGTCSINFEGKQIEGVIIDGKSYAPVREVGELLNLRVGWDNVNKIVKLNRY
jgi:N-acetylmuramoyl-L-alanine amidase